MQKSSEPGGPATARATADHRRNLFIPRERPGGFYGCPVRRIGIRDGRRVPSDKEQPLQQRLKEVAKQHRPYSEALRASHPYGLRSAPGSGAQANLNRQHAAGFSVFADTAYDIICCELIPCY